MQRMHGDSFVHTEHRPPSHTSAPCLNAWSPYAQQEKFRRIRLTNPKIQAVLVQVPGCLEALEHMGWIADEADKEFLMISPGKYMSMKEVSFRLGQGRCRG